MQKRGFWKTRSGFYLAAMGSAFGLGNLWRFPYIVGENGGGAFVLLYFLLALVVGLPLLIGELMIGKSTRKSVVMATAELCYQKGSPYRWIGKLSVVLSLFVLSYYAVICGWVLYFLTQFWSYLSIYFWASSEAFQPGNLELLQSNGWLQMGLVSVHILIAVAVVMRGVQDGLERWIGALMPVFVFLLAVLTLKSLALPGAVEALRFLFYPDFSRLGWNSLNHAIGHVLFTLSVGFGTMVTFGSYLKKDDHIPTAGFRVAVLDTILSLIAGVLIFPIALSASEAPLTDPGLLFEVVPQFLFGIKGGPLFGFAFFACLYLAALGASIGLLEVIVSNVVDVFKVGRGFAGWISGAFSLIVALLPGLSTSVLRGVGLGHKSVLENFDSILINWFLPLIAFGFAVAIVKGLNSQEKENLFSDEQRIESVVLYPHWVFVMRWIVPVLILTGLCMQVVGLFLS